MLNESNVSGSKLSATFSYLSPSSGLGEYSCRGFLLFSGVGCLYKSVVYSSDHLSWLEPYFNGILNKLRQAQQLVLVATCMLNESNIRW